MYSGQAAAVQRHGFVVFILFYFLGKKLQGKRLLCNDMWGLGLITLSLVVGYTEMETGKRERERP
jgi:hypothetical protein